MEQPIVTRHPLQSVLQKEHYADGLNKYKADLSIPGAPISLKVRPIGIRKPEHTAAVINAYYYPDEYNDLISELAAIATLKRVQDAFPTIYEIRWTGSSTVGYLVFHETGPEFLIYLPTIQAGAVDLAMTLGAVALAAKATGAAAAAIVDAAENTSKAITKSLEVVKKVQEALKVDKEAKNPASGVKYSRYYDFDKISIEVRDSSNFGTLEEVKSHQIGQGSTEDNLKSKIKRLLGG